MDFKTFLALVRELRAKQKEYLASLFPSCLDEVLALERKLDEALEELKEP